MKRSAPPTREWTYLHRVVLVAVIGMFAAVVAVGEARNAPRTPQAQPAAQPAQPPGSDLGSTDTPMLPGLPWHVHDPARRHPPIVTPASTTGGPPSDATILFSGADLSKWAHRGQGADAATLSDAKWTVRDGYFETTPRTGALVTRESFGDIQLHIEWASPSVVTGNSQGRGNSGVLLMGRYEVQVLDSYENVTYADGQAAAIYGQWPPLANAARKPGEWQTYDIVFEAPRFEADRLVRPAYVTVMWNGVLVHNRKELMGTTVNRNLGKYTSHPAELPLVLQDHNNPVRFRNVWVRRLGSYDQPEKQ